MAPPLDDPIWQHALCDPVHHTVTWHLPGEEETSTDRHSVFVQIGRQLQTNLDCHNGGAIHLDDYPLDPGPENFRAAQPP